MHPRVNICLSDCSPWDDNCSIHPRNCPVLSPFPKIPLPRETYAELCISTSRERRTLLGNLKQSSRGVDVTTGRTSFVPFVSSYRWHFYLLSWTFWFFVSVSWFKLDSREILRETLHWDCSENRERCVLFENKTRFHTRKIIIKSDDLTKVHFPIRRFFYFTFHFHSAALFSKITKMV